MGHPSHALPADLAAAQRRIEAWRSKANGSRRRLPQRIWDMAADLVPSYGVNRVSRVLRLEYYKVKEHAVARQAGQHSTPRPSSRPTKPTFVEVCTPSPVMSASLGCIVELADDSGRKMTIRSSTGIDAAGLVAAFCGETS